MVFITKSSSVKHDIYSTVFWYCTVLYCTVLYCTVLYCTVLYCIEMYCTVLYCTVLYQNRSFFRLLNLDVKIFFYLPYIFLVHKDPNMCDFYKIVFVFSKKYYYFNRIVIFLIFSKRTFVKI